jgi:hypothetical protein
MSNRSDGGRPTDGNIEVIAATAGSRSQSGRARGRGGRRNQGTQRVGTSTPRPATQQSSRRSGSDRSSTRERSPLESTLMDQRLAEIESRFEARLEAFIQRIEGESRTPQLIQESIEQGRPLSSDRESDQSPNHKYAIKLANPATFTDGVDPTFEQWEWEVERKLAANPWQFPTEATKLAWVSSLVGGEAGQLLRPYTSSNNSRSFTRASQAIKLLRNFYNLPN